MLGEGGNAQGILKHGGVPIPLYFQEPSKWSQIVRHEEGPRVVMTLGLDTSVNFCLVSVGAGAGAGGQVCSGAFVAELSS